MRKGKLQLISAPSLIEILYACSLLPDSSTSTGHRLSDVLQKQTQSYSKVVRGSCLGSSSPLLRPHRIRRDCNCELASDRMLLAMIHCDSPPCSDQFDTGHGRFHSGMPAQTFRASPRGSLGRLRVKFSNCAWAIISAQINCDFTILLPSHSITDVFHNKLWCIWLLNIVWMFTVLHS